MSSRRSKRRRRRRAAAAVTLVLVILAVAAFLVWVLFALKSVTVEGSVHEAEDEVTDYVTGRPLGKNALADVLTVRNLKPEEGALNFVSSLTAELTGRDSITIHVREKSLTGYLYDDSLYWYFDGNGIAQAYDASPETEFRSNSAILLTEGLTASQISLGKPIQVPDPDVFDRIETISKYAASCEIRPDKVTVADDGSFSLSYGDAVVLIGDGSNLEMRLEKLTGMIPSLKGRAGTLHLENYDGSQTRFIFDQQK